jgi:hypothetical protein
VVYMIIIRLPHLQVKAVPVAREIWWMMTSNKLLVMRWFDNDDEVFFGGSLDKRQRGRYSCFKIRLVCAVEETYAIRESRLLHHMRNGLPGLEPTTL